MLTCRNLKLALTRIYSICGRPINCDNRIKMYIKYYISRSINWYGDVYWILWILNNITQYIYAKILSSKCFGVGNSKVSIHTLTHLPLPRSNHRIIIIIIYLNLLNRIDAHENGQNGKNIHIIYENCWIRWKEKLFPY